MELWLTLKLFIFYGVCAISFLYLLSVIFMTRVRICIHEILYYMHIFMHTRLKNSHKKKKYIPCMPRDSWKIIIKIILKNF